MRRFGADESEKDTKSYVTGQYILTFLSIICLFRCLIANITYYNLYLENTLKLLFYILEKIYNICFLL